MIKLTKEQEEAIELLKKLRFSSDEYYIVDGAYAKNIDYLLIENAIETVLHLLETKQNRIQELKKALIDEDNKHREEIKNKDKIIDLMAKSLIGVIFSDENNVEIIFEHKEELKQYFENQAKM